MTGDTGKRFEGADDPREFPKGDATILADLQRLIKRCETSLEELENALDSLDSQSSCLEAMMLYDTSDLMLSAILDAISDCN